jgi:hypothetical protein
LKIEQALEKIDIKKTDLVHLLNNKKGPEINAKQIRCEEEIF